MTDCEVCGDPIAARGHTITLSSPWINREIECCSECFGATVGFLHITERDITHVVEDRGPPIRTKEPSRGTDPGGSDPG